MMGKKVRKATVIVQSLIRGSLLRFQLKRQQSAALCIQVIPPFYFMILIYMVSLCEL